MATKINTPFAYNYTNSQGETDQFNKFPANKNFAYIVDEAAGECKAYMTTPSFTALEASEDKTGPTGFNLTFKSIYKGCKVEDGEADYHYFNLEAVCHSEADELSQTYKFQETNDPCQFSAKAYLKSACPVDTLKKISEKVDQYT